MLFMYLKNDYFCTCSKTTQLNALYVERGLPHLNINIVYSKVLQTLSNFDKPMWHVKTQNDLEQTMTGLNKH